MLVETKQQKAETLLKEFLENELGDYSFHWSIEFSEEYNNYFYFTIRYGLGDKKNLLSMRVNSDKEFRDIEIDIAVDNWEVVERFSWRIKYFWIKVIWE